MKTKTTTVPCDCGNTNATWHGPDDGVRTFSCDACWKRQQARDVQTFPSQRRND